MLDIDALRIYYDQPFIKLMNGLEMITLPKLPSFKFWYYANQIYFELDEDTNILNFDVIYVEGHIRSVYEIKYYQQNEIKFIITSFFKRHYGLNIIPNLEDLRSIKEV